MTTAVPPFHLAIPVDNLEAAAHFYGHIMQLEKGRSSEHWIDWNFYQHQFVTHLVEQMPSTPAPNEVDAKAVPVPHFGVVLNKQQWESLAKRFEEFNVEFVIEPYIRFKGQVGEQGTFFLKDPAGNALEFKYFEDMSQLFAS